MAMRHGTRRRGTLLAVVALSALASLGCKQGENDRCQVDDDCGDALRCCRRDDPESLIIGGICTRPESCELTRDASVSDGAGAVRDAGSDLGAGLRVDGAAETTRDAGRADGSVADRGRADAQPIDAAVASDAGASDALPANDGH
ncbi:MAG: hypothetical protein IPL40_02320 [Proteobacteria bacterium]|nr:hypothetical protein [Pseudomonadota bacterium]